MLLADKVCVVCCKLSQPKKVRERFNKLLGIGQKRKIAEFSDAVLASGALNDCCHAEFICSSCEKKIKKGVALESIRPKDVVYPNCESDDCGPGNCNFDSMLSVFKTKKSIKQQSLLWFEEDDLTTIRQIMTDLQIHSFGPQKSEFGSFRQLILFRTRTNICACQDCWFLTIKKPSSKNWIPPVHNCNPNDETRFTVVLEEISLPPSASSLASSTNELNDAILFDELSDDSQTNNRPRKSIDSVISRKRLSEVDISSPPKKQRSDICPNSFKYSDNRIALEMFCQESIDETDTTHKDRACNYRYGNNADWWKRTGCRKRFLNELLNMMLAPTFKNDFLSLLNQRLENVEGNEDETVVIEQNQTVSKVKVIHVAELPRPILIATRYTTMVNLTEEKVRNIAGSYCSRRELQRQIQKLRSTGLRPPKNITIHMSQERKLLQDQILVADYDEKSFMVHWSSSGLLDFMNR